MVKPRFRMFAGPNGSGKSTLFAQLRDDKSIHTEIYISADKIEKDLKANRKFNFNAYRVKANEDDLFKLIADSALFPDTIKAIFLKNITLKSGVLEIGNSSVDSYLASLIASYLVDCLFISKQSFCFETVMSHPSKVELLKKANDLGFKTYLYFVYLDNPILNIFRVSNRVSEGGHAVTVNKITERYYRSFQNLLPATAFADVVYVINNSNNFDVVAEKHNRKWLKPIPKELSELCSKI